MTEAKPIWKSKTFWINVGLAAISIVQGLGMIEGVSLPVWLAPSVTLVVNILLRFVTDSPAKLGIGGK